MRQTTPTTTSNNNNINNTSWILRIHQGHERIKKAVHEGMRIPLPRWGQRVMALVYFTTPILGGYAVMQWAIGKSHASIGPNGEFLPNRNQPVGQPSSPQELQQQVPVYGVSLASSNEESQRKNKEKLQRFLRQQFKQQNKQPKQQEETKETSSRTTTTTRE